MSTSLDPGLRIVLVTDSFAPDTDPAAEAAREVCDALLAAGHHVLVLTTSSGSGRYRAADLVRLRTVPAAAAIRARILAFSPDVVQVLRPRGLGATTIRALEDTAVPVVALDPGPLHPRAGTTLSTSATGARLLAMVGVDSRVWRPGVRTDEYHPGLRSAELHDAWARASSPGGPRTVVGYAGPVGAATTKSVRRLVRVAGHESLRLVVLGRGPGTAALKQAGARIVGKCGGLELGRGLASLDVFVQPRRHESGLGVVRKALASGVPVVAFDTAANAEVVVPGHNGVLVPTGQGRAALAEAVAALAADDARRASLAARARDSLRGRDWSEAVGELVGIYRALRPSAGAPALTPA